jgi:hypothetical protein
MSDAATVNMFWHGQRLPPLAWACMRSFADRGHRLRVFCYHDLEIPAGVELADAGSVLSREVGLDEHRVVAAFSDIFRYELLYKYGGWWVDTDVFCLTPHLPSEPYAWAEQEPGIVNGAILRFPKNDALCSKLLGKARKRRRKAHAFGAIGPDLLTKYVARRTDLPNSGSTARFYPWNWLEAFLIWFPGTKSEVLRRAEGALFVHFWDYALRQMGMDAFRDPPPGSYWAELIENCPNRLTSDAGYLGEAEKSVRNFGEKFWNPDRWSAFLEKHPDLFAPEHVQSPTSPLTEEENWQQKPRRNSGR